jgi:hypothetical protein
MTKFPESEQSRKDEIFKEAERLFANGALEEAFNIFKGFEEDDRWFVRAYFYLNEICIRVKNTVPPGSEQWNIFSDYERQLAKG